jgi:LDH2 family malate/lactate/ureidoglycolate dehydrogenase
MATTIIKSAAELLLFSQALLEAVGTPPELAVPVAESLVGANLSGHDSHGMQNLPGYLNGARRGQVQPAVSPVVTGRDGATAVVDGGWGWGQPAARLATETAISLAREYGVSAVVIERGHHIGRAGEYVETMAVAGVTGIVMANSGLGVAPYGGIERRLGTNPFAWAAPTADPERPLLLDFATSSVAGGKLQLARAKGQETIPPGLILDTAGHPTTRLADYFEGGPLLTFGDHKGYAMSVMAEVLGGVLSGGSPSILPGYKGGNGTLLIALRIAHFQPLAGFIEKVGALTSALKSTHPAEGVDEVLLPGEPEIRARTLRCESGIPLPEATWGELCEQAGELGVAIS